MPAAILLSGMLYELFPTPWVTLNSSAAREKRPRRTAASKALRGGSRRIGISREATITAKGGPELACDEFDMDFFGSAHPDWGKFQWLCRHRRTNNDQDRRRCCAARRPNGWCDFWSPDSAAQRGRRCISWNEAMMPTGHLAQGPKSC